MPLTDAARVMGVSYEIALELVLARKLKAARCGQGWQVSMGSVMRWMGAREARIGAVTA